jgi:hypothetical protein
MKLSLDASSSTEPILIIKKEIIANPKNSIKETNTNIIDILVTKNESFLGMIECIDLINVSIEQF